MIESIRKNQEATRKIIKNYQSDYPEELHRYLELERFIRYFAKHIMNRVQDQDCYFVDMLEDIERLD